MILAETERFILRRYQEEDLQDLYEYLSDIEVVKYEPYKPLYMPGWMTARKQIPVSGTANAIVCKSIIT